jgi:hypothetical protein
MPISVAELNKSAAAITRRGRRGPIRARGGSSSSTSSRNDRRGADRRSRARAGGWARRLIEAVLADCKPLARRDVAGARPA